MLLPKRLKNGGCDWNFSLLLPLFLCQHVNHRQRRERETEIPFWPQSSFRHLKMNGKKEIVQVSPACPFQFNYVRKKKFFPFFYMGKSIFSPFCRILPLLPPYCVRLTFFCGARDGIKKVGTTPDRPEPASDSRVSVSRPPTEIIFSSSFQFLV